MKRIEVASDGTSVITRMVQLVNEECYLLIQEIKDTAGFITGRTTITLTRDDIEAMHSELEPAKPLPEAEPDGYCYQCDEPLLEAKEDEYLADEYVCCSQECVDAYWADR